MKMNIKANSALVFFALLMSSVVSTQCHSQEFHFFKYHLPAPPARGTAEYLKDLNTLEGYQATRTPEQCASAEAQSTLSLNNAFGPETGVLTAKEIRQARGLSIKVAVKAAVAAFYFKNRFKKGRPFVQNSEIIPCIRLPKDFSYPSGHATTGYALALVLAKKFPEKSDMIMKQGLQIGENRLVGGVHFPSDVAAGRILAAQIAEEMTAEATAATHPENSIEK